MECEHVYQHMQYLPIIRAYTDQIYTVIHDKRGISTVKALPIISVLVVVLIHNV